MYIKQEMKKTRTWISRSADAAIFFLRHTSESSHFVTCVYSCLKLYSQLHTTRFVLVLNNKPCVYHLVNVLRLDPALCSVGFTTHIWDITTPQMCLCVYDVPTDGFMSPTQCVCVVREVGLLSGAVRIVGYFLVLHFFENVTCRWLSNFVRFAQLVLVLVICLFALTMQNMNQKANIIVWLGFLFRLCKEVSHIIIFCMHSFLVHICKVQRKQLWL